MSGPDPDRTLRVDTRLKRALESGSLPRDLLICGPAGTGKTFGILTTLHVLAADYPGLRILFCRKTRRSLTDSALVTYEQEVLPADGMGRVCSGASRRHRGSYSYPNGSEVVLGGLDEPGRIASTAWDLIYANEAIELTEEDWETLGSRLNRPGRPAWAGYLIGDTNPGDPSHWLKKRCDEGRTVLWDTAHEANPAMHDGRHWTAAGLQYKTERLDKLKGTRRKRLRDGLWAAGEGQWFSTFDPDAAVTKEAEFDPRWPVHLAVDSGVHVGAVWFQVRTDPLGGCSVTVFADYYAFDPKAFPAAQAILAVTKERCGGRFDRGVQDPSGDAKSPTGVNSTGEFARAGLRLDFWPRYPGSVVDGLSLIDSFVSIDPPALTVHPRCRHLIDAFSNYRRAKRANQFIDTPEDPQHPYEELMDALRGGLMDKFPEGRRPEPPFRRVHAGRVF